MSAQLQDSLKLPKVRTFVKYDPLACHKLIQRHPQSVRNSDWIPIILNKPFLRSFQKRKRAEFDALTDQGAFLKPFRLSDLMSQANSNHVTLDFAFQHASAIIFHQGEP